MQSSKDYHNIIISELDASRFILLNSIINYFFKSTLANLKVEYPINGHKTTDNNNQNVFQKLNNNGMDHLILKKEKSNYHFYVCPGLTGPDNHRKVVELIKSLPTLSSIVFILNGGLSKLDVSIKNSINQLKGSFPFTIKKKVYLFFSNTTHNNQPLGMAELKSLAIKGKKIFTLNSLCFQSNPDTWKGNSLKKIEMGFSLENSYSIIERFLLSITNSIQSSTSDMGTSLAFVNETKSCLQNARIEVKAVQKTQDATEYHFTGLLKQLKSKVLIITVQCAQDVITPVTKDVG
ncbi:hypothetical protein CYY_005064 [Polysphondylium violaceum]|uniref:Uncharacterized protein n=1 Tax=Polysphondylium violaceum TaxID=133409 RepID=A0A8J4PU60_9MYCE|nr:hypothetical protein CYY_005064 [Polysphondylium violaceum]